MGGATSSLTTEDITELRVPLISEFTAAEIKSLYKRFEQLDRSKSGFITQHELQLIPELSLNPLGHRIIELFDTNHSNQINFKDFVRILWIFHERASKELKIKFAFQCFDVDNDGRIDENDLFHVLHIMVSKQFEDHKLSQIVRRMIENGETKSPKEGFLTFQELVQVIGEDEILQKMTIPFRK